jgi:hypothetical protein
VLRARTTSADSGAGITQVVTTTGITGDRHGDLERTIHVAATANMATGVYVAQITHSVS